MKTFNEYKNPETAPSADFPSFTEVREGKGSSCVSEKMSKMIKEMMESGCKEMEEVHGNDTPMTAENWMKECESMIRECSEGLMAKCNECMG
jgi:hypothetical protein